MSAGERATYMQNLRVANADYITEDPTDLTKPILYKPYTEVGVTEDDHDGVFKGGSVLVKGYLTATSDDARGSGWNAKFTTVDNKTHDQWLAEPIPYYVISGQVQITVDIINATRNPGTVLPKELAQYVEMGASTRGTIAFMEASKALALINGRNYVTPEDVKAVFSDVVGHRIVLAPKAKVQKISVDKIIESVYKAVPVPKRVK
jgi:hypothetical protein